MKGKVVTNTSVVTSRIGAANGNAENLQIPVRMGPAFEQVWPHIISNDSAQEGRTCGLHWDKLALKIYH